MCCNVPPPHYNPSDFPGFSRAEIIAGLTVPATIETPAPRDVREATERGEQ